MMVKYTEFTLELYNLVNYFYGYWQKQHKKNPQQYPVSLPDGEWWEQFLLFVQQLDESLKNVQLTDPMNEGGVRPTVT